MAASVNGTPNRTPLYSLHRRLGAKMVVFAGYEMPLSYPSGVLAEHHQTREKVALFDVSHMGQLRLSGGAATRSLERLCPADLAALQPFRQRYTLFTNETGGILDDLMVANVGDHLRLVVNAARRDFDLVHLRQGLDSSAIIEPLAGQGLLALQGPAAA